MGTATMLRNPAVSGFYPDPKDSGNGLTKSGKSLPRVRFWQLWEAPNSGTTLQPSSGFYVQTGAFTTPENAERQRGAVSSYGASEISQASAGGRDVYRVRLGPYTTPDAAGIVADRLKRSGYGDARVVAN
jgi:hypothetical protein